MPRLLGGRMSAVAAVAAGGLGGSATRIWVGMLIPTSDGFPTEIVVVNLAGSFLLGIYLARRERAVSRPAGLHFWAIGVFGSFTTFSAFSVDLVELLTAGRFLSSITYVFVSLIGGMILALIGQRIGAGIR